MHFKDLKPEVREALKTAHRIQAEGQRSLPAKVAAASVATRAGGRAAARALRGGGRRLPRP